jgi:hypothetical protein
MNKKYFKIFSDILYIRACEVGGQKKTRNYQSRGEGISSNIYVNAGKKIF